VVGGQSSGRLSTARRQRTGGTAILYFEDFTEGQVIELGTLAPLTDEEIIAFAREWDPQPFHVDPVAAKNSIYGGLIASGWQTALRTMHLQVENLLNDIDAQGSPGVENIRFRRPVRPATRCWWPSRRPAGRRWARSSGGRSSSTRLATSSTRWTGGV